MDWKHLLSDWERAEIEHAQFYATYLRHPIPEGDRLILIARLAKLVDRVTGSGSLAEPVQANNERVGSPFKPGSATCNSSTEAGSG